MLYNRKVNGFTLIEIIVVIALISILAAITFVAINPAKTFADVRNAQRQSNVSEILNAVTQYTAESGHALADFGAIATCPATSAIGSGAGNINLSTLLVDTYIAGIPVDPSSGTAANTGYTICKTASNRVTIAAPDAENGQTISVKR